MKHRFRFFGTKDSATWVIAGEEVRHLQSILRLNRGDEVEVFDGQGQWAIGVIEDLKKNAVLVKASQEFQEPRGQALVKMVIGALKPKVFEDILSPLTELGCQEFHVFLQSHTPKAVFSEKNADRWQSILRSAAKQCKCSWIPRVFMWKDLGAFLTATQGDQSLKVVLDGEATEALLDQTLTNHGVYIVLGSESGLSQRESSELKLAGYRSCHMGFHVLRASTAAIAATSVMGMKAKSRLVIESNL
jgi:16S rRNA (uracil1498-N3)-methyltransferase